MRDYKHINVDQIIAWQHSWYMHSSCVWRALTIDAIIFDDKLFTF